MYITIVFVIDIGSTVIAFYLISIIIIIICLTTDLTLSVSAYNTLDTTQQYRIDYRFSECKIVHVPSKAGF